MPWHPDDADRHFAGLDDKGKRQWAAVANSSLSACLKDGGDQKECEAKAVRQANGVVGKSLDSPWSREVQIKKLDEDEHLVFGWLSVAVDAQGHPIVDLQDDVIEPHDLEKAAYDFVLYSRNAGEMHRTTSGIGKCVESMVFTKAKQETLGIPAGALPECAWWIGFKVDDEAVWKRIKSGEYAAFSIGGRGDRIPYAE